MMKPERGKAEDPSGVSRLFKIEHSLIITSRQRLAEETVLQQLTDAAAAILPGRHWFARGTFEPFPKALAHRMLAYWFAFVTT